MSEKLESSESGEAEPSSPLSSSSGLGSTELSEEPIAPKPPRRRSWIKFEDEKSGVATIEPSHSVQVSSHSHPLAEDALPNQEAVAENKEGVASFEGRRSVSPILNQGSYILSKPPLSATKSSPALSVLSPQKPTIPKSSSSSPTNNNFSTQKAAHDFRNDLQSVPLSDHSNQTSPQRLGRSIQQGFNNGDIIVTLLPVNQKCPWITKAEFKPELVPEELMAQGLTLTVEDYVMALQVLVNDVRFNLYITCYKRVLLVWIILGFIILLSLLFSGVRGLALFGGGIVWLIVNAIGIFICMWVKVKLYRMLERCMASVNALMFKHRTLLGLDDRGKISCHKINLIFVYFDVSYCIKYLKDMLDNEDPARNENTVEQQSENQVQNRPFDHSRMDIDTSDIIITGNTTTRVSQKEKYAEKLLVRYSQRWVKEFVRKRLDLNMPLHGDIEDRTSPCLPRHCTTARCPCQYIEEHLRFKPRNKCSIKEFFI
ncbi:uncharacterized protein LOC143247666 [Tachypleus tridentatus]|uniref:uncharacterized protein LOC143247666 n=1 Tax=Tachypleus tridentatus TaxID=6853 RepID=UPI003FD47544